MRNIEAGDLVHAQRDHGLVTAGQLLARLNGAMAGAERKATAGDLATKRLLERGIPAKLAQRDLLPAAAEDRRLFSQVQNQWPSHRTESGS